MTDIHLVERIRPCPFHEGPGEALFAIQPGRLRPGGSGRSDDDGRPDMSADRESSGSDRESDALANLTASPDELRLRLGSRILTLGYRARGRRRLIVRPLEDCADSILASETGGSYRLKPARIEAAAGTAQGRPADAACLPVREAIRVTPPAGRVARFAGASVTAGIVTSAGGRTVAESLAATKSKAGFGPFSRDARGTLLQSKPRFCVQRRLHGHPAVLLKQPFDVDYRRWLIEGLPRLALVGDHFDLRDLVFIVSAAEGAMRGHYEDSLALFGIRPEQIVEAGDETLVVDDLIYPAPLTTPASIAAPRCLDVLEQVATRVRADPTGANRLYVSGTEPAGRTIANEAAIVAIAERHGFTVVEPETLSLFQQIGLFRQARIVVGAPGAALYNAMFSTTDLTLFALATDAAQDIDLAHLMSSKEGRYMALHGTAHPTSASVHAIDESRFENLLRSIIDVSA